uniref:Uncharacterized protein n=1 Tax=Arundo donax TaxID=35708 RepID=A0A0A9BRA8_ARUDO
MIATFSPSHDNVSLHEQPSTCDSSTQQAIFISLLICPQWLLIRIRQPVLQCHMSACRVYTNLTRIKITPP